MAIIVERDVEPTDADAVHALGDKLDSDGAREKLRLHAGPRTNTRGSGSGGSGSDSSGRKSKAPAEFKR